MIRYSLICSQKHEFESWFPSSEAYDEQVARGFVSCPLCGDSHIEKSVMAPHIGRKQTPHSHEIGAPREVALMNEDLRKLHEMVRALRTKILATTADVGVNFAEEARRIHEGEAEPRPIRGQATGEEARALLEEGIEVLPIPALPEDRN